MPRWLVGTKRVMVLSNASNGLVLVLNNTDLYGIDSEPNALFLFSVCF